MSHLLLKSFLLINIPHLCTPSVCLFSDAKMTPLGPCIIKLISSSPPSMTWKYKLTDITYGLSWNQKKAPEKNIQRNNYPIRNDHHCTGILLLALMRDWFKHVHQSFSVFYHRISLWHSQIYTTWFPTFHLYSLLWCWCIHRVLPYQNFSSWASSKMQLAISAIHLRRKDDYFWWLKFLTQCSLPVYIELFYCLVYIFSEIEPILHGSRAPEVIQKIKNCIEKNGGIKKIWWDCP